MMGLPIKKLVVATNENDVLDSFSARQIPPARHGRNAMTSSPSMDISGVQFRRFLFDFGLARSGDGARVEG